MKNRAAVWSVVALGFLGIFYSGYRTYRMDQELAALSARLAVSPCAAPVAPEASATITDVTSATSMRRWSDLQPMMRDTVVQIFSYVNQFNWLEPYKTPEQGQSAGSGFFINEQGDIMTNAHVVGDAVAIAIQLPSFGKRRFEVELVGISPERDLALLRLTDASREVIAKKLSKIKFLPFGNSDKVCRADELMALGYPLGQQSLKSTTGVVSGFEHIGGTMMIQMSAPINPGSSGGPCVTMRGEIVGVSTAGIMGAQNVGYIIPSNDVQLVLSQFADMAPTNKGVKFLRKPFLGVIFNNGTTDMVKYLCNPEPGGLYVVEPYKNGLLKKAGVQSGDMIYDIDGHAVDIYGDMYAPWSEDRISLGDYVSRLKIGDTVRLGIYRKGKRHEIKFVFQQPELAPVRLMFPGFEKIDYEIFGGMVVMELALNHLGQLMQCNAELARFAELKNQMEPAVVVTHFFADSQAFKSRVIKPGGIIKELNGVKIKTLADFRDALAMSCDTGFITIKFSEGAFTVISFDEALQDEPRLSRLYFYPITENTKNLLRKKGVVVADKQSATAA